MTVGKNGRIFVHRAWLRYIGIKIISKREDESKHLLIPFDAVGKKLICRVTDSVISILKQHEVIAYRVTREDFRIIFCKIWE